MDSPIPIDAVHAYHAKERQLYSRLVFELSMEPTDSMKIIAFWLWLEENGHNDVIHRINSLDNSVMFAAASVAHSFVEALLRDAPAPYSSVTSQQGNSFRQAAIRGITYYLNNVCCRAFGDIQEKAEREFMIRRVEALAQQMSQESLGFTSADGTSLRNSQERPLENRNGSISPLRESDLPLPGAIPFGPRRDIRVTKPLNYRLFVPHGEGSSSGGSRWQQGETSQMHGGWIPPNLAEFEKASQVHYPFDMLYELGIGAPEIFYQSSASNVPMLGGAIDHTMVDPNQRMISNDHFLIGISSSSRTGPNSNTSVVPCSWSQSQPQPRPRRYIPREERTLFVTFSNGYPLTKEELYNFFMRHYGDVELITVEEPKETRAPLYAHITFYSLDTVFRVLNGNGRAKFMTNGKHLWARRFIPQRNLKREG